MHQNSVKKIKRKLFIYQPLHVSFIFHDGLGICNPQLLLADSNRGGQITPTKWACSYLIQKSSTGSVMLLREDERTHLVLYIGHWGVGGVQFCQLNRFVPTWFENLLPSKDLETAHLVFYIANTHYATYRNKKKC